MNEVRRNAARALFMQDDGFAFDPGQPANARTDQNARADLLLMGAWRKARIRNGLPRGGNAIDDKFIDFALLLRLHPLIRIVGAVAAVAVDAPHDRRAVLEVVEELRDGDQELLDDLIDAFHSKLPARFTQLADEFAAWLDKPDVSLVDALP